MHIFELVLDSEGNCLPTYFERYVNTIFEISQ